MNPAELRALIRTGAWDKGTAGACSGYLQANLVVLPAAQAAGFAEFCSANPTPLPLLERTEPGQPDRLRCAPGADLRTDLPGYLVYRRGELDAEVGSIERHWRDDHVAFLLGCSFSAEAALLDAGVRLRHVELDQIPPMFVTGLRCEPTGGFHGPMVVSMRPISAARLDLAVRVTANYPMAHGAPVHTGDPAAIGIADIAAPDWGEPMELLGDEVPVFWACGVTPQAAIRAVKPEFAVTHAPGRMFVTDLPTKVPLLGLR